jgi:hypothetical protein
MRFNPIPLVLLAVLSFASTKVIAQSVKDNAKYTLQLRSGAYTPEANFSVDNLISAQRKAPTAFNKQQVVLQFEQNLSSSDQELLKNSGIDIINYISGNAYIAIISSNSNTTILSALKTRAVFQLLPQQKIQPELVEGKYPAWAVKNPGTIDLLLSYASSFNLLEIKQLLAQKNIDFISSQFAHTIQYIYVWLQTEWKS